MPQRIFLTLLILNAGVVLGVSFRPNASAEQPKDEKKENPIPVEQVRTRGILGELGRPLGTIVTIEGITAGEDYTKLKRHVGQVLLRVDSVNGTKLKSEVVFQFNGAEGSRPKVGAKFKYVGYETGGYEGGVPGREKYVMISAEASYWFRTEFHIFKDELKRK